MTVAIIIVIAVVAWCVASVIVAVVAGRVIARANRDAQLQQRTFERRSVPDRVAA